MRFYTNNGVSSTNPNSRSTSCLHIARNLIRPKEFGNSHVAPVYTTFSSRISNKSPIGWRNNLTNGKIQMIPSENFAHDMTYAQSFMSLCLERRPPVVGLSLGPARRKPVIVGFSYIFVDIAAKFFRTIGGGTTLQVDGRMRSRRTSDVGARGKRYRINHRHHEEQSWDGMDMN